MARVKNYKQRQQKQPYMMATKTVEKEKLIPIQGRQKEIDEMYTKSCKAIKDKSKLSLYVSGQPGQGKTLSINHTIQKLLKKHTRAQLRFVSVNGMTTKKADAIFVQMWKELTESKSRIGAKVALKNLEDWLSKPDRPFLILLLDEIDGLLNTSQSTIYHIFEWIQNYTRFILISVSNTFDLPEKVFKQKIVSRVGHERLDFNPYTSEELVEIAKKHLCRIMKATIKKDHLLINNIQFDINSLKFCGSKVASVTSDARKMLNICTIIIHMARDQMKTKIDISFTNLCLKTIFSQPCDQFLKSSIQLNPLFGIAICKLVDYFDVNQTADYNAIINIFWDVYIDSKVVVPDEVVLRQYIMLLLNTNILKTNKKTDLDHYTKCLYHWNGSLTFEFK